MPTNYQGNPNVTRSPSAAPGPRVIPTVAQPNPGEPSTAASVAQAFDVAVDFIGHIQSAVGLDTPVVAAANSGFTAPSYNAFGGTITPSGSVKISTGTRFVIQIQTGGIVGTATFKTSMDGGNTYGALQTTAASMTDATSGITLAFSGTFTANGTATFRSGFTPQAQWQDAAGNVRYVVDHIGYATGARISQIHEEWIAAPFGGTNANYLWNASSTGGTGAVTNGATTPSATYGANSLQFTPATGGSGQTCQVISPSALLRGNASWLSLVMEFEVGFNAAGAGSASSVSFKFGLTKSGSGPFSASELTLYKPYSDTHYYLFTCDESGTPNSVVTTVVASATGEPNDKIRLVLHGSASPYGATAFLFINGALAAQSSTHLPGAVAMSAWFGAYNIGAPAGSPLGYLGPIAVFWNRYLSNASAL